ncbi:MAG: TetR/AcrR family transcriptional regulator [Bacillus sp. (in: firmicutes)]
MDLRVLRTKEAIQNALIELIEEKGFESITVKDITNQAKINRGTFYAHYQDKFDLMSKCQESILNDMQDIITENLPKTIVEIGSSDTSLKPISSAIAIFDYLNKNSRLMKAMLSLSGDLSFQTKMKDFMWKALFEENPNVLINEKDLLVPGEYLSSYIASAHLGVIQKWLNNGMKENPQEMAEILSTITIKGPFGAAGLVK